MKFLYKILLCALVLWGCYSDKGYEPKNDYSGVAPKYSLSSLSEIPLCTKSLEGMVVYIPQDMGSVYACSDGFWVKTAEYGYYNKEYDNLEYFNADSVRKSNALDNNDIPPPVYDQITDSRDGKSYKTVVIGGKTWMAENLNFATDSSFCYDDVPANCTKYGRLYQEFDAEKACPEGWALPTEDDWRDLVNTAKSEFGDQNGSLRALDAWEDTIFGDNVVATNATGFSALPGGYRASTGECDGEGKKAYFWGVSNNTLTYAWILSNQYDMDKESGRKGYFAYSVRCVKN